MKLKIGKAIRNVTNSYKVVVYAESCNPCDSDVRVKDSSLITISASSLYLNDFISDLSSAIIGKPLEGSTLEKWLWVSDDENPSINESFYNNLEISVALDISDYNHVPFMLESFSITYFDENSVEYEVTLED